MNCSKALFAFMFMLTLTCNLNAQEETNDPKSVIGEIVADTDESLDFTELPELPEESASDEAVVDDEGETVNDEDELEEDGADEYENSPISVRVNEHGELVGAAQASVSGNWLPVEANIALVSDGVLLSKIVAGEDGSFAFPNIAPGSYNVYGTASSYCGRRVVTVLSGRGCCNCGDVDHCDSVGLGLTQDAQGACYSDLASAPAATFSGGFSSAPAASGGFGGGGGLATGGGIATGGGAVGGASGLRLLAVGGIATAIAVGTSDDDDDEASPSN